MPDYYVIMVVLTNKWNKIVMNNVFQVAIAMNNENQLAIVMNNVFQLAIGLNNVYQLAIIAINNATL